MLLKKYFQLVNLLFNLSFNEEMSIDMMQFAQSNSGDKNFLKNMKDEGSEGLRALGNG